MLANRQLQKVVFLKLQKMPFLEKLLLNFLKNTFDYGFCAASFPKNIALGHTYR